MPTPARDALPGSRSISKDLYQETTQNESSKSPVLRKSYGNSPGAPIAQRVSNEDLMQEPGITSVSFKQGGVININSSAKNQNNRNKFYTQSKTTRPVKKPLRPSSTQNKSGYMRSSSVMSAQNRSITLPEKRIIKGKTSQSLSRQKWIPNSRKHEDMPANYIYRNSGMSIQNTIKSVSSGNRTLGSRKSAS